MRARALIRWTSHTILPVASGDPVTQLGRTGQAWRMGIISRARLSSAAKPTPATGATATGAARRTATPRGRLFHSTWPIYPSIAAAAALRCASRVGGVRRRRSPPWRRGARAGPDGARRASAAVARRPERTRRDDRDPARGHSGSRAEAGERQPDRPVLRVHAAAEESGTTTEYEFLYGLADVGMLLRPC